MREVEPQPQQVKSFTLPNLNPLTDAQLAQLALHIEEEQHRRALNAADPDALTEEGFNSLFDNKDRALPPIIQGGILICAGSVRWKSATSHDCSFVRVDSEWIWEHGDLLNDEVRNIPAKPKAHMKSVSLLPAISGMKVDVASGKKSTAGHKTTSVTSYTVQNGELVLVSAREVPHSHGTR